MTTACSTSPVRRALALLVLTSLAFLAAPQPSAESMTEAQWGWTLVNRERAARKLPRLALDSRLSAYAQRHSVRMGQAGRLWHQNLPADLRGYGYRYYGENVGYSTSVYGVHTGFMRSPTHRANVLKSAYRRVGVGVTVAKGRRWVTLVFAS